jgi:hypothetical protein
MKASVSLVLIGGLLGGLTMGGCASAPMSATTGVDPGNLAGTIALIQDDAQAACSVEPTFDSVANLIDAWSPDAVSSVEVIVAAICDAVAKTPGSVVLSMAKKPSPTLHTAVVQTPTGKAVTVRYKVVKRK